MERCLSRAGLCLVLHGEARSPLVEASGRCYEPSAAHARAEGGSPLRVLGIDPGSRFCGVGVVEELGGGRVGHVHHAVIVLDPKAPLEDRLVTLHQALQGLLATHRPTVVAVEEIYHAKNARSALVLGHARGVALLAARQQGAEVRSFAASVIKQAVTGSGRAEKTQVGRMVCALLGIKLDRERTDASDALATALCGLLRGREPMPEPVAQRTGKTETPNQLLRRLQAEALAGRPRRRAT